MGEFLLANLTSADEEISSRFQKVSEDEECIIKLSAITLGD